MVIYSTTTNEPLTPYQTYRCNNAMCNNFNIVLRYIENGEIPCNTQKIYPPEEENRCDDIIDTYGGPISPWANSNNGDRTYFNKNQIDKDGWY